MRKYRFWAGGYGSPDEKTLFKYEADFENGTFERLIALSGLENPSYLLKRGDILYSVEEMAGVGNILTFFTGEGRPRLITREITLSGDPCHIAISGDRLIVSNYSGALPGGGITLYRINPDGTTSGTDFREQTGSGPVKERQAFAHAHSAYIDGERVTACDLGADMLFRYRIENDRLVEDEPWYAPPGSGPRHMVTKGEVSYLLGELSAHIYVLKNGEKTEILQDIDTLPEGTAEEKRRLNRAAAIKLSPDGRYLFVSNRGEDTVTVFKVNDDKILSLLDICPCGAPEPRDITLFGDFILCANQAGKCITALEFDREAEKLSLLKMKEELETSPSCIISD
mgnify:CR=1 FL=1